MGGRLRPDSAAAQKQDADVIDIGVRIGALAALQAHGTIAVPPFSNSNRGSGSGSR